MRKDIVRAVEEGYIKGIHEMQSKQQALKGFHEDFRMVVKEDGISHISLDEWLKRLNTMISENEAFWSRETKYDILSVESTVDTAYVKVKVYKGKDYFSTDMFLLYKFDAWKIVSKIYSVLDI